MARWHRGILLLVILGGWLATGCSTPPQERALAQQGKVKVEEVETRILRLRDQGGDKAVLAQETVGGPVQAQPLSTAWLNDRAELLFSSANQVLRNKRVVPRRKPALLQGDRVVFPGPAEADRVLLQIPATLPSTTVLLIDLPLPPPMDQPALEPEEGVVLRVESAGPYQVQWDAGYVVAAGLPRPALVDNHSYFRLEYDGEHWLLVAMPGRVSLERR